MEHNGVNRMWLGLVNPSISQCQSKADCNNHLQWLDGEAFATEAVMPNTVFNVSQDHLGLQLEIDTNHNQINGRIGPMEWTRYVCQFSCSLGKVLTVSIVNAYSFMLKPALNNDWSFLMP